MRMRRDQFIGVKLTAAEWCALYKAAKPVGSLSVFIRAAIARAINNGVTR